MNGSLVLLLALSGVVGSGHCVLMCGAASASVAPLAGSDGSLRALLLLQVGRICGYASLGAMAAAIGTGLFDAMSLSQAVRPLWVVSNLFALSIGGSLLLLARQPGWLDRIGERIGAFTAAGRGKGAPQGEAQIVRFVPREPEPGSNRNRNRNRMLGLDRRLDRIRHRNAAAQGTPLPALRLLASGFAWAAVPCGLLYSALVLVMISARPPEGALAMAAFAGASAIPLLTVQLLFARASNQPAQAAESSSSLRNSARWALRSQSFGARALGLLMLIASGYAVYSVALGDAGRLLCHG